MRPFTTHCTLFFQFIGQLNCRNLLIFMEEENNLGTTLMFFSHTSSQNIAHCLALYHCYKFHKKTNFWACPLG